MSATPTHAAPAPEVDAYGFAPTRIVRVKHSRNGGVIQFFRVWMKPSDLQFPQQERELLGEERMAAVARYFSTPQSQAGEEIRLDAGVGGMGVSPNFLSAPQREVGVSPGDTRTHEGGQNSDATPEETPAFAHAAP